MSERPSWAIPLQCPHCQLVTHEVESDDGRTAACPRCGGDVTAQAEALAPYYNGLSRIADAAREAERRGRWFRVAQFVVPALIVILMVIPATQPFMTQVLAYGFAVALFVGLWMVFTGRL